MKTAPFSLVIIPRTIPVIDKGKVNRLIKKHKNIDNIPVTIDEDRIDYVYVPVEYTTVYEYEASEQNIKDWDFALPKDKVGERPQKKVIKAVVDGETRYIKKPADGRYRLESLELLTLENNVAFSYTDYDVLYSNGKIKHFCPKKTQTDYKTLLKKCDIGCLTVMYDTNILSKVYMPLDTPKREDYATWLDITKTGVAAYKLNRILAIYRLGNNTVSSNKLKLLKYHYNVYRKHEGFSRLKSFRYLLIHSFNKIFKKY